MPDREKTEIIDALTRCAENKCNGCPYFWYEQCITVLAVDALALLKEDPVKPHRADAWPRGIYLCGDCGVCITVTGYRAKYCMECGRKVAWDG